MGQTVNYQPQQGSFVSGIGEQAAIDWSALVNAKVVRGILQPRAGWRILRRPRTYTSVADASSADGFSWQAATFSAATMAQSFPLGSFLFSATNGQDWICSVWNDGTGVPLFLVHSSNGELLVLATTRLTPTTNSPPYPNDPENESTSATYTFARYYDTVFFCNGGYLWKWEPLKCQTPYIALAFHNPRFPNTAIYFSGFIRGPRIVVVHQDSLLLAGFNTDFVLDSDGVIATNSDGFISEADATKVGGFQLAPDQQGVVLSPYTVIVSDPLMPNCFMCDNKSVVNLGSQSAISAMASHMGRLVVWTQNEMWLISGTVADLNGASLQPISRTIGCVGPRAHAQNSDGVLIWLNNEGIAAWSGGGAPQLVSTPVQDLFGNGINSFWRWAFTAASPDPQVVGNMPLNSVLTANDMASAVWVAQEGYFAVALTTGNNRENNDLVLCWSPNEKQFWCYTAESSTPSWALAGVAPNQYWAQGAATRRSALAAQYTLMVSQNEAGMLFSQGYSFLAYNIPGPFPNGFLGALATTADEADDATGNPVTTNRFAMIAVSTPIFLGNSDERLHRRLYLRLLGLRVHDFLQRMGAAADTNPLRLYVIAEQGHADVINVLQTSSTATEQTLDPWQDPYDEENYFWQGNGTSDVDFGIWGGTGQANTVAVKRWLTLAPVDKRVDLASRVSQWIRIALVKIVDGTSDDSLRLVSAAIEVYPNYGPRR